jgi:Leucine-rich repeat (LRR) protein
VAELDIQGASHLISLAGLEGCSNIQGLFLDECGVSSLQPLGAVSSLERLYVSQCGITSLEGLYGWSLQSLRLRNCTSLAHLSGVEQLTALKRLEVERCGVTSLQPLSQLGEGLQYLSVEDCSRVQEVVLELPHVQPTADVRISGNGVREVLLAGGVIRAVRKS